MGAISWQQVFVIDFGFQLSGQHISPIQVPSMILSATNTRIRPCPNTASPVTVLVKHRGWPCWGSSLTRCHSICNLVWQRSGNCYLWRRNRHCWGGHGYGNGVGWSHTRCRASWSSSRISMLCMWFWGAIRTYRLVGLARLLNRLRYLLRGRGEVAVDTMAVRW